MSLSSTPNLQAQLNTLDLTQHDLQDVLYLSRMTASHPLG